MIPSTELVLSLYRTMIQIREFELKARELLHGSLARVAKVPCDQQAGKTGDGGNLAASTIPVALVASDGVAGPAYLVSPNFGVIMKWNRSTYFATSVGLLADRIAGG